MPAPSPNKIPGKKRGALYGTPLSSANPPGEIEKRREKRRGKVILGREKKGNTTIKGCTTQPTPDPNPQRGLISTP
jgi:hypothetical protein